MQVISRVALGAIPISAKASSGKSKPPLAREINHPSIEIGQLDQRHVRKLEFLLLLGVLSWLPVASVIILSVS